MATHATAVCSECNNTGLHVEPGFPKNGHICYECGGRGKGVGLEIRTDIISVLLPYDGGMLTYNEFFIEFGMPRPITPLAATSG